LGKLKIIIKTSTASFEKSENKIENKQSLKQSITKPSFEAISAISLNNAAGNSEKSDCL